LKRFSTLFFRRRRFRYFSADYARPADASFRFAAIFPADYCRATPLLTLFDYAAFIAFATLPISLFAIDFASRQPPITPLPISPYMLL